MKRVYYDFFPNQRPGKEQKDKVDNTFRVNKDGSISLNHDSDTVQKAFIKNIEKLQNMKKNT